MSWSLRFTNYSCSNCTSDKNVYCFGENENNYIVHIQVDFETTYQRFSYLEFGCHDLMIVSDRIDVYKQKGLTMTTMP